MIFCSRRTALADPPSSRPHAGVLGGPVFRFGFRPGEGAQRVAVPGLDAVVCTADTVLHWAFYADGDAAVHAPWAPLAVTVDARVGAERLSDDVRVRDRYGFRLDADSQFAAAWSMPEQWNADTVSLAPFAGRTAEVEIVLGTSALATDAGTPDEVTGFVELRVEEHRHPPFTRRTRGHPARLARRRPVLARQHDPRGRGAARVHLPHPGDRRPRPALAVPPLRPRRRAGRRLEAAVLASAESVDRRPRSAAGHAVRRHPVSAPTARRRWIAPGSERAHPHVWSAMLDGGLRIEATATDHVGLFRVEGDDSDAEVGFIIDQPGAHGTVIAQGDSVQGWVGEADPWWGNGPRTFFAGVVRGMRPARAASTTTGEANARASSPARAPSSCASRSPSSPRAGTARARPGGTGRDDVRRDPRSYPRRLGRGARQRADPAAHGIRAPFRGLADTDLRAQLASALYRLHLYPNAAEENVGSAESPRWAYADPFTPAGRTPTRAPERRSRPGASPSTTATGTPTARRGR
jgi:hypothetical protein